MRAASGGEQLVHVFDLSHKLTTFEPSPSTAADERVAADLRKPIEASQPVPAFSDQMVLIRDPDISTGDGVFSSPRATNPPWESLKHTRAAPLPVRS